MMPGIGMGYGFLGVFLMLLFWGILIALAVWLVRIIFQNDRNRPTEPIDQNPRRILDVRYARGEITREQYEQMKSDISQTGETY